MRDCKIAKPVKSVVKATYLLWSVNNFVFTLMHQILIDKEIEKLPHLDRPDTSSVDTNLFGLSVDFI